MRPDHGVTLVSLDHGTRAVTGTRFYGYGGLTVAVRQAGAMKFLASDHHARGARGERLQNPVNADLAALRSD